MIKDNRTIEIASGVCICGEELTEGQCRGDHHYDFAEPRDR